MMAILRREWALEPLLQDVRFGIRTLRRSPVASVIAVLSMALGIGATTAIFSMLHAIAWKPLPVTEPGSLVQIRAVQKDTGKQTGLPAVVIRALRDQRDVLAGVAVDNWDGVALRVGDSAERAIAEVVTADFFTTAGVTPFLGSYFPSGADGSAWEPVTVISHDFFTRRLNGDDGVIGQSVRVNGYPFRIIGVSPRGFFGLNVGQSPDLRIPMMLEPGRQARLMPTFTLLDQSTRRFGTPVARLQPGVTREQAEARLQTAMGHIWADVGRPGEASPQIHLLDGSRGRAAVPAWITWVLVAMLAGAALLLLIACVNVVNLFAARAIGRRREFGVRVAIGATRGRLVQQLLTESVLIASAGAALGFLIAQWGSGLLLRWLPQSSTPIVLALDLDARVLLFTGAVAVLTAVVCGVAPAIQASRLDPLVSLKADAADTSINSHRPWGRRSSVVMQVALTFVLVVGAGLLARSLQNIQAPAAGYDGDAVLLFSMKHARDGNVRYVEADVRRFLRDLPHRVAEVPGILDASIIASGEATGIPGTGLIKGGPNVFERDDRTTVRLDVMDDRVSPSFFRMFQLAALAGRTFTDADTDGTPRVVIITDALARDLFGRPFPIGRQLRVAAGASAPAYEIVGVISSRPYDTPSTPGTRAYLLPLGQDHVPVMPTLAVKVLPAHAAAAIGDVRRLLQTLDPDLPIFNVRTATQQRHRALAQERLATMLFTGFGALALGLASIGVYGVISADVARRVPEIGIRIALGAPQGRVVRSVVADTLRLVLLGIALGLPLAYALARLGASALHGLRPDDPVVFAGTLFVITAVGMLAGWVPARRAARTDPVRAMRAR